MVACRTWDLRQSPAGGIDRLVALEKDHDFLLIGSMPAVGLRPRSRARPPRQISLVSWAPQDGILNKIDPGEPLEKDLYELEPEEAAKIKSTPGSLGEVLERRCVHQGPNLDVDLV
jgi:hypothetical protein